jgi:hypothetical protein
MPILGLGVVRVLHLDPPGFRRIDPVAPVLPLADDALQIPFAGEVDSGPSCGYAVVRVADKIFGQRHKRPPTAVIN